MRLAPNGESFGSCYPVWVRGVSELVFSDTTGATFGIFGRWGSGKSSALDALIASMAAISTQKEQYVECIPINCLDLQLSSLREKLDARIRDLIGKCRQGPALSQAQAKSIGSFVGSIWAAGLKALSVAHGVDPGTASVLATTSGSAITTGAERALEPLAEKPAALSDLRSVVKDARVIWCLDDLDRCAPDKAISFIAQAADIFSSPVDQQIVSTLVIACDPEVLARHAAAVYGVTVAEGMEAITKYIHVPIFVPTMATDSHLSTIPKHFPSEYRGVTEFVDVVSSLVGVLPLREILSALPQTFIWLSLVSDGERNITSQSALFKTLLWWSLVSINLPTIMRGFVKDPESLLYLTQLFKIKEVTTVSGDKLISNFGELAVETIRVRPDLCSAFQRLIIGRGGVIDATLVRRTLLIAGGKYVDK